MTPSCIDCVIYVRLSYERIIGCMIDVLLIGKRMVLNMNNVTLGVYFWNKPSC
jgi:hypothetical protein